jgi:hypothetical protein
MCLSPKPQIFLATLLIYKNIFHTWIEYTYTHENNSCINSINLSVRELSFMLIISHGEEKGVVNVVKLNFYSTYSEDWQSVEVKWLQAYISGGQSV